VGWILPNSEQSASGRFQWRLSKASRVNTKVARVPLRFGPIDDRPRVCETTSAFPGDVTLSRRHALIDYQEGTMRLQRLGVQPTAPLSTNVLVYSANQFVPSGSVIKCGQTIFSDHIRCKVASKPPPLQQPPPVSVVSIRLNDEKPKDSASEAQIAPSKAKPEWFGAGTTLRLHGFIFESPMVYVGESLAAPRSKGLGGEPSLIIPSRSIKKPNDRYVEVVDDSVPPSILAWRISGVRSRWTVSLSSMDGRGSKG